jgi:hypothetical protein
MNKIILESSHERWFLFRWKLINTYKHENNKNSKKEHIAWLCFKRLTK